ncbi:hypothetical protein JCM1393_00870 [Clostridium carnis]
MSNRFKTGLYIVGGVLIIGLIAVLAIQLLFWALPFIIAIYLFVKIKNMISKKKNNSEYNREDLYDNTYIKNEYNNSIQDDEVNEVIDVDFEDISNK